VLHGTNGNGGLLSSKPLVLIPEKPKSAHFAAKGAGKGRGYTTKVS
jgi:hypothetical protein